MQMLSGQRVLVDVDEPTVLSTSTTVAEPDNGHSTLPAHVQHLRYAVATTSCRATAAALRNMLRDAEARLQTSWRAERI